MHLECYMNMQLLLIYKKLLALLMCLSLLKKDPGIWNESIHLKTQLSDQTPLS